MTEFKRIVEPWAPLTQEQRMRLDVPFEREEWYFAASGKMNKVEHVWKHTAAGLLDEGRKGHYVAPVVNYEQMVRIFEIMKEHDCTLARAVVEVVGEKNISQVRLDEMKTAPAYKHREAKGYVPPSPPPIEQKAQEAEWKDLNPEPKGRRVLKKVSALDD